MRCERLPRARERRVGSGRATAAARLSGTAARLAPTAVSLAAGPRRRHELHLYARVTLSSSAEALLRRHRPLCPPLLQCLLVPDHLWQPLVPQHPARRKQAQAWYLWRHLQTLAGPAPCPLPHPARHHPLPHEQHSLRHGEQRLPYPSHLHQSHSALNTQPSTPDINAEHMYHSDKSTRVRTRSRSSLLLLVFW